MVKWLKKIFASKKSLKKRILYLEKEIEDIKEHINFKNKITNEQLKEQKKRKEIYREFYAYGEPVKTREGTR